MSAPLPWINLPENVLSISGVSNILECFSFMFVHSLLFGHQSSAQQGTTIQEVA